MEIKEQYPLLKINLESIRKNAHTMMNYCANRGIDIAGVIKFSDGNIKIARSYYEGGCKEIASSRTIHLKHVRKEIPQAVTMLLRLPMMWEIPEVIKYCDISLNSEKGTLISLNKEAKKIGKTHNIILMLDVGDLREGLINIEDLYNLAVFAEHELNYLNLLGIGTTFACFGSILPSHDNLETLINAAKYIEKGIGRKLKIISGGSSVNLTLLQNSGMPKGINHLRIGGTIANPRNIRINRGVSIPGMEEDTFILYSQLIEVGIKPSLPFGKTSLNWAGNKVEYIDCGLRKRAIAALGSQDVGDSIKLLPRDKGIKVIGCSSDHTILDLEESDKDWKVGDIVSFNLSYLSLMYTFCTRHVKFEYIHS